MNCDSWLGPKNHVPQQLAGFRVDQILCITVCSISTEEHTFPWHRALHPEQANTVRFLQFSSPDERHTTVAQGSISSMSPRAGRAGQPAPCIQATISSHGPACAACLPCRSAKAHVHLYNGQPRKGHSGSASKNSVVATGSTRLRLWAARPRRH